MHKIEVFDRIAKRKLLEVEKSIKNGVKNQWIMLNIRTLMPENDIKSKRAKAKPRLCSLLIRKTTS